ncbi:hypothetical protein QBC35DRAFT_377805, partial [Podospora australis]
QEPFGVDQRSQQRSTYLCAFPRFPVNRSGESVPQQHQRKPSYPPPPSRYSTPRTLPPFPPGSDFHYNLSQTPKQQKPPPRILLPVSHRHNNQANNNPLSPPAEKSSVATVTSPPKNNRHSRTVFTSATVRPLRLVQQERKRRPTVFYAQHSHSVVQSLTYITINQDISSLSPDNDYINKMASNPVMPKVAPPPPSLPSAPSSQQEKLLADLRRQLDDSASDASSVDSRGRRRRRNNKQLAQAGGLGQPAILPRLADTKPVRLQLGLNLDVEVELKARLQGDVSLTLLAEKKVSARPPTSVEIVPDILGCAEVEEMFYMRIGRFSLRQTWLEREVSASLTATVVCLIALAGFVAGFLASRWVGLFVAAATAATSSGHTPSSSSASGVVFGGLGSSLGGDGVDLGSFRNGIHISGVPSAADAIGSCNGTGLVEVLSLGGQSSLDGLSSRW